MYPIKQSTAITVPFFVHDANGDAVTGLTDGSFTKRISKNGAAFGAMTVTISEMENGWYSIPLSSSHSDTTGLLTVVFTNAGAKQVNLQWRVQAKLNDDLNDVAATQIVSAGAITTSSGAVSTVTSVTNGVSLANGAVTDASLAGNMEIVFETDFATNYNVTRNAWVTNAQDFVGTTAADPFNAQVVAASVTGHTPQTGDSFARLGAPVGASISADIATVDSNVDAILVDTAEIGAAGAGLTAVPWNAAWDAEVQSEANDALVALGLDHMVSAAVTGTDITDNSIIARMVSSSATADWDSFANTTDSLQALRDRGDTAWITATTVDLNADQSGVTVGTVTTLTGHTAQTGDSFARLGAPVGASISADIATVDANVDAILADTGTDGVVVASIGATAVDSIWDEAMVETTGAPAVTGTFRAALEWMFALSRNRITQTATTTTLRNDANSADLATSTVSDDATTYVRGEWST